jgi:hypothetical protein
MFDKDFKFIQEAYGLILEADASSNINQALKMLRMNKIKTYRQAHPEESKIPEDIKIESEKELEDLKKIVDDVRKPEHLKQINDLKFGINYNHLPQLANYFLQRATIEELKKAYKNYSENHELKAKKFIQNTPDWHNFSAPLNIHDGEVEKYSDDEEEEIQTTGSANSAEVYSDNNIIVYCINDPGSILKSIDRSVQYGQGAKYGLCISSSNAGYYYADYRWNKKMSTYFVYFKQPNENAPAGFILIDAIEGLQELSFNSIKKINYTTDEGVLIDDNNKDVIVSETELFGLYPEIEIAFEKDVFKSVPIVGKEKETYKKVDNAKSVMDLNSYLDFIVYIAISNHNVNINSLDEWLHVKKFCTPKQFNKIIENYTKEHHIKQSIFKQIDPDGYKKYQNNVLIPFLEKLLHFEEEYKEKVENARKNPRLDYWVTSVTTDLVSFILLGNNYKNMDLLAQMDQSYFSKEFWKFMMDNIFEDQEWNISSYVKVLLKNHQPVPEYFIRDYMSKFFEKNSFVGRIQDIMMKTGYTPKPLDSLIYDLTPQTQQYFYRLYSLITNQIKFGMPIRKNISSILLKAINSPNGEEIIKKDNWFKWLFMELLKKTDVYLSPKLIPYVKQTLKSEFDFEFFEKDLNSPEYKNRIREFDSDEIYSRDEPELSESFKSFFNKR